MRSMLILGAAIALAGCSTAVPARSPQAPAAHVAYAPPKVATPTATPATAEARAADASNAAAAAAYEPNTSVYEMLITAPPTITRPPCDLYTVLTPAGIAVEFVADRQPVAKLRAQVQAIADRLNSIRIGAPERHQLLDDAATFGMRSILALHPVATVTPTENGARLQINATSAADVTALRAHVLWHSADFLPGVMHLEDLCPTIPGVPVASVER